MKIVTHKYKKTKDQVCYLVNLVDISGRPLESHVAHNKKERKDISEELAEKHKVSTVFHNCGFSIVE
tara:strand:+ start:97 stop:297 length:201 start_codon:yes stop_codon:yes gene_type:complete